jgi:hypothetical protein
MNTQNMSQEDYETAKRYHAEKERAKIINDNFYKTAGLAIVATIVVGALSIFFAVVSHECMGISKDDPEAVRNAMLTQLLVAGVSVGFLFTTLTTQGIMSNFGRFALSIAMMVLTVNTFVSFQVLRAEHDSVYEEMFTYEIINMVGLGIAVGVFINALFMSIGERYGYNFDSVATSAWPGAIITFIICIVNLVANNRCSQLGKLQKASTAVSVVSLIGSALFMLIAGGIYFYKIYSQQEKAEYTNG